jgi:hypothetical protein
LADETKRYLALVQFKSDTTLEELAYRVPGFQGKITKLSRGESEQAFRTNDGLAFGMFFRSALPRHVLWSEFDHGTSHGDTYMIIEAGPLVEHKGFGRAAAWLQHH